jgi:hypothetical protein
MQDRRVSVAGPAPPPHMGMIAADTRSAFTLAGINTRSKIFSNYPSQGSSDLRRHNIAAIRRLKNRTICEGVAIDAES